MAAHNVTHGITINHRTYWDGEQVGDDALEVTNPERGIYLRETVPTTERMLRLAEEHCRRVVEGLRDTAAAERVEEVAHAIETLQTAMHSDITARLHDLAYGPALGLRHQPAVILTGEYEGLNTHHEADAEHDHNRDRGDGHHAQ